MTFKLSKEQIKAIANRIIANHIATKIKPIVEFNHNINNSEEYVNFFLQNEDCIILNRIESESKLSSYHFDNIRNDIKGQYFRTKYKPIPCKLEQENVIDEIYLATIDAKDMESLIKIVSEKFM